MQARNFLLFIVLTILILYGWWQLEGRLAPNRAQDQKAAETKKAEEEAKAAKEKEAADARRADEEAKAVRLNNAQSAAAAVAITVAAASQPRDLQGAAPLAALAGVRAEREAKNTAARRPSEPQELVTLGSDDPASPFHLKVIVDPLGAVVRQIILNKFRAGDDWGQPTDRLLELLPLAENRRDGSFLLLHYDDPRDKRPLDTLAKRRWQMTHEGTETLDDGRQRVSVSFATTVNGVRITKTFGLTENEYHLSLEVGLKRVDSGDKPVEFRYQVAGAHGLPVEGKWYTSVFRNALIARLEKGSVDRDIQDLRQISIWGGGKRIDKDKGKPIRYAAVAVQFFASVIVVDDEQENQDFLAHARPTLETYVVKGRFKGTKDRGTRFVVETDDQKEQTFYVGNNAAVVGRVASLQKGERVAVVATSEIDRRDEAHEVALALPDESRTQPLWVDDITVRVTTEPIELRKDEVVHKYLLYNGPVKPSLLGMPGHASVPAAVVERYVDKLKLNTLTDYQSASWIGSFSKTIYWTDLLILCTNLMHWVLSQLNRIIPNYGLCIICLTVLVRGLMFPISRKQALMSMKMQELAPEMKKLQAKYKGDRQALGMATMELYRKHKVNPFGTCWFLLLQMPIFMGLYFCLQESVYFRLAGAWPTWIHNLAAPDMLWRWGEGIPWLSSPDNYGGFLYLGPYLNLLPLIAVTLMIFQQKMLTPPPQDEQQEMQQKVMKYMMIFFGLLFYKVAAGLCIYFIASSIWGFAERRLLPKKNLNVGPISADAALQGILAAPTESAVTTTPGAGGKGRKQGRGRKRLDGKIQKADADGNGTVWSRFRRRVGAWWADMVKKADKK
jgi:YidC/Oxa1 family membrane protein insertase